MFSDAYAQTIAKPTERNIEKAREIIRQKAELYLSISEKTILENNELLELLSIDYFTGKKVYAYCNARALDFLVENQLAFSIERSPGDVDYDLNMKSWEELANKDLTESWDFYPTYEAYVSLMNQFQSDYPEFCQIHNVVTLASGRSILFARISANVNQKEVEPRFMYTSTIHGDETTGFILSLRMIHYLLSNYGSDDEITELLDNMEIWISPNENPDGTYTNNNNTVSGATRSNTNGVDLNRNYPNPVNNPSTPIQLETQTMINLTDTLHFVMSANMHGGIECVNYPWDSWTSNAKLHADHDWWQMVSHEYADTARFYSPSNYMNPSGSSFYNGVTHGGDWYVVYGGRQDFMTYYRNQREFTLELSNTKLLPAAQLPAHWNYNYRSLINYMKQALYGIRGTVTDLYSGEPIAGAKIELIAHDTDNSWVFAQAPHGDFYRPLIAGSYSMRVTADGYNETLIENISINNYQTYVYNVQLAGDNPFAPPINLVAHTGNFNSVYLEWESPDANGKEYSFFNPDAYQVFRDGEMIGEGEEAFYYDSDLALGTYEYFVKAVYNNPAGVSHPSESVSVTLATLENYIISATAEQNGNIVPAGEVQVVGGNNKTFTITPAEGFIIDEVFVDGQSVGVVSAYTFTSVSENHSIHATFKAGETQSWTITFNVLNQTQQPIADAIITFDNQEYEAGYYVFKDMITGAYNYIVSKENYQSATGSIAVSNQDVMEEVVLLNAGTIVQDIDSGESLSVFPNPAFNHLFVKSDMQINLIILTDISGREVFFKEVGSQEINLDLSEIKEGIYLLTAFTSSGVHYKKVLVQ